MGLPADRLVLVGESDPRGGEPLGLSPGRSGARLCRILDLSLDAYLGCRRVNLAQAGGWWDAAAAARAASSAMRSVGAGTVVVMLGRRVAAAFGYAGGLFTSGRRGEVTLVSLPHPSGRNRTWNDPRAAARARRVVRSALAAADAVEMR